MQEELLIKIFCDVDEFCKVYKDYVVNLISGLAAYHFIPKKPSIYITPNIALRVEYFFIFFTYELHLLSLFHRTHVIQIPFYKCL